MRPPRPAPILLIAAAVLALAGCDRFPGQGGKLKLDKDRFEAALDPAVGGPDIGHPTPAARAF